MTGQCLQEKTPAVEVMSNKKLQVIAADLVRVVRSNARPD